MVQARSYASAPNASSSSISYLVLRSSLVFKLTGTFLNRLGIRTWNFRAGTSREQLEKLGAE